MWLAVFSCHKPNQKNSSFSQVRMVVRTITRKKTHEKVKEELLKLLRENDAAEEPGLNIDNVNDPGEATAIING